MSEINFAVTSNYEHGGGYGFNEYEVRHALKNQRNLLLLKIVTYDASLWSIVGGRLFWIPLFWGMFVYPVFVLLFLVIKVFVPIAGSTFNLYAIPLTYLTSVWLSLRKQTPVRDFKTRREHVGTKTLHLDCHQRLLVAEESYYFMPAKNRLVKVPFERLHARVVWHQASKELQDDDTCSDSVSIYLKLGRSNHAAINMSWANQKIDNPVFNYQYDCSNAAQSAIAKEKCKEFLALLEAYQIRQR